MKLILEKYSYRSGELHLKSRAAIAQEIDDVLLNTGIDFSNISREQLIEFLRQEFITREWEIPSPILDQRGKQIPVMDFIKDGVGMQLGFQSVSLDMDVLKLQTAYNSEVYKIDFGIYIVTTSKFQQQLRSQTGQTWTGPTLQAVQRKLPAMGRLVEVPVCAIGLEAVEGEERIVDLSSMTPIQVKEITIQFLEDVFNQHIDRDVSEIGRGANIGFEGIMRLEGMNVVISIELSKTGGTLRSKLLADSTRSLADEIRQYQKKSGHKVGLMFILVGDFSTSYVNSVLGDDDVAHGWAEDVDVGYRLIPLDKLAMYVENKRGLLRV